MGAKDQREFLRSLFRGHRGWIFLSTKDRVGYGAWRDHGYHYPDQLNAMVTELNDFNERGYDVYFSPQLYANGDARDKNKIVACPMLWSDLDDCHPEKVFPEPSVALETSPGRYHGFWLLDKPLSMGEATAITQKIAQRYADQGADKGGWDATQVLRIPGTINRKPDYDSTWEVDLLWSRPEPYCRADFNGLVPVVTAPQNEEVAVSGPDLPPVARELHSEPPMRLTQSERTIWDQTAATVEDRSNWAFHMVSILKEHGLADKLVLSALVDHPVYLDKAQEKWGGRTDRIEQDIQHCCEVWRKENSKGASLNLERGGAGVAVAGHLGLSKAPYQLVHVSEVFGKPQEVREPLVDGLLWNDRIHWVFGPANVGKSLFVFAMALHVAAGKPFLGRKVKQGPVAIYSEDNPHSISEEYLGDLAKLYGIDWLKEPFYVNRDQGLRVHNDEGIDEAMLAYVALPEVPRLVIYDSCETVVPSSEYSTAAFDPFTRLVRQQVAMGSAVVVIDHVNSKDFELSAGRYLDKLFGGLPKKKFADVAFFMEGSFQGGMVNGWWAKFRGRFPPSVRIFFDADHGFTVTDNLPSVKLTADEQRITRWLNAARTEGGIGSRRFSSEECAVGTGLEPERALTVLRRLSEVRWVEREVRDNKETFKRVEVHLS